MIVAVMGVSVVGHGQKLTGLSMIALCAPILPWATSDAEHLDDDADADQRGDVGGVVGRRHLDDLERRRRLRAATRPEDLQRLARQEAAGLRPAGAGHEAAVDAVDVEGDVDRVGVLPRELERDLGGLLEAELLDVADGQDIGLALARLRRRRRAAPASRRCRAGRGSSARRSAGWSPSTRAWCASARRGPSPGCRCGGRSG